MNVGHPIQPISLSKDRERVDQLPLVAKAHSLGTKISLDDVQAMVGINYTVGYSSLQPE